MGFTTPCFIRKNTPELRKKLEELRYKLLNSGDTTLDAHNYDGKGSHKSIEEGRAIITSYGNLYGVIYNVDTVTKKGRVDCEAIDTIVGLFNERNAMKYYYVIFAHQKKENEKYNIATVNMKSNQDFNPYKAADVIKEQLKANDVIIRSWQEISETAYNSYDNE